MADAVLIDLDGTLFDVSGMRHYVTDDPRRKNFDAFHKSACLFAPVNAKVMHGIRLAKRRGWAVLIVTARKRQWGYYSKMALDKYRVPYDRIYMRENDDDRRDYQVKRDILARIRSQGYNVVWAWDDNPNVVQLWLEEGIPVTWVPGWEYE
jgi:phosphoglycolate phosphatase-like HAD superfamily hydrolase